MRPLVLLFDIDGTMLTTDGAGRRALARAFDAVVGAGGSVVDELDFAGATDPAIVRQGLRLLGAPDDDATMARVVEAYVPQLRDELTAPGAVHVHPGVGPVLDAVCTAERVAVGLGTGNVEGGAWAKVERAGLAGRFAFGGFGSDHEDRPSLLRIGAARGAATLGCSPEACRVVIVGDTPRDVAAAHAIGAECLAVATGLFTVEALARAGATWVVATLDAAGVTETLLGEGAPPATVSHGGSA